MDCQQISPLLSKYIDQELNTKETALVYEHMTQCSNCKEEVTLLERWDKTFKNTLSNHPFGSSLAHQIMGTISQEQIFQCPEQHPKNLNKPQGQIIPFFSRKVLSLAATLLLVVSFSVWFLAKQSLLTPVLTQVATIEGQKGVMIFKESQNGWIATEGKEKIPLYSGNRIWNKSNSNYSFSLKDNTRITLNQKTQLSLQVKGEEQHLEFYGNEGKALFQVTPQKARFQIRARSVLVEVVGTAFLVDIKALHITTTVFEGKVKVSPSHQKALFLTQGQEAQVYNWAFIKVISLNKEEYEKRGAWATTFSAPPLPITIPEHPTVKPEIPKKGPVSSPPKTPGNTENTDTPIKVNRKKK